MIGRTAVLRNDDTRYGGVAQALHWLMAGLILVMFGLGFYMTDLPLGQQKFALYQVHKSLGVTVLTLAVVRLLWRTFNPPPPLPATMAPWERRAASLSHTLLYVLLFAQPIVGYLQSSAANFPVVLWGFVQLPTLIGTNETLGEVLLVIHHLLARIILVLLVVHVGAALRHHFVLKDDILRRMLPAGKR